MPPGLRRSEGMPEDLPKEEEKESEVAPEDSPEMSGEEKDDILEEKKTSSLPSTTFPLSLLEIPNVVPSR